MIQSSRRAGHRHRGRPARPGGRAGGHAGRRRRRAAGQRSPRPPARGMRDIVATIQREQDEAIRSPASGVTIVTGGPGHRQDRGGAAPGGVPALLRPQPVRRRRHPGGRPVRRVRRATSRRCCRRSARTPRRCARSARWCRRTARRGPTRPTVAAIKGSLRMRRVLERRLARRRAGRPDRAAPALPRRAAAPGRRPSWTGSGAGRWPAAPGATRCAAPASTGVFDALWAQARSAARSTDLPEKPDFEAELADRGDFRDFLRAWWPRLHPDARAALAGRPGAAAVVRQRACSPATRSQLLQGSFDRAGRADDRRRGAAGRAGRADGPAAAAGQRKSANPFHVRRRGAGGQHVRGPAGARPAAAAGAARRTTTASTRTWWSTRRRTSRRCSGG